MYVLHSIFFVFWVEKNPDFKNGDYGANYDHKLQS